AEIVSRGGVAHAGLHPQVVAAELRGAVGVEAGFAQRHVNVGLGRLAHVRHEGVGGILHFRVGGSVDGPGPATKGGERRVVHAVDGVGAVGGVAGHQLAGRAVEHLGRAGGDDGADLILHLGGGGVDGEGADVAPVHREGTAPAGEQAAGIPNVHI